MTDDDDDYVWVEDRDWLVPSMYGKCRAGARRQCPKPPVADLVRRFGSRSTRRWAYCADHLYGRRLEDGKVLHRVMAGSPAATRGWI